MNCQSIIPVAKLLDKTIHTREAANELINIIAKDPCDPIELDFSEVEYISRSFADQLHFLKLEYALKSNRTIIVHNANEAVFKMLQAVSRTQKKTNRVSQQIPVFKYSSVKEIEGFLLSI